MIREQSLKYNLESQEILKQLSEGGKWSDQNENIELNFFGDKEILKNKQINDNQEKDKEKINYVVGKYKDFYIGCLSINNFESREKFGLNKYFKDYFYIGQWKENKKEGIGFLKINENVLYLGEFSNNQINGFGMIYYKDLKYFYFGTFIDGQMDNGIYYNAQKLLFYHGKFKNGKKNDNFCTYFDIKNNHIFVGEVRDDLFIKGYISFCEIKEEKKDNIITTNFSCDQVIFFDKTDPNNIKYKDYYNFNDNNLEDKLQDIFMLIFEVDLSLRDIHDNYVAFFENLENMIYNDSYTEYIVRYNPEDNSNIEKGFIKNYNVYHERFIQSQKKLNLEDYKDVIII